MVLYSLRRVRYCRGLKSKKKKNFYAGRTVIFQKEYIETLLSDKNIRTKVLQAVTICNSKLKLRVSKTQ